MGVPWRARAFFFVVLLCSLLCERCGSERPRRTAASLQSRRKNHDVVAKRASAAAAGGHPHVQHSHGQHHPSHRKEDTLAHHDVHVVAVNAHGSHRKAKAHVAGLMEHEEKKEGGGDMPESEYDCQLGLEKAKENWSQEKAKYCCDKEFVMEACAIISDEDDEVDKTAEEKAEVAVKAAEDAAKTFADEAEEKASQEVENATDSVIETAEDIGGETVVAAEDDASASEKLVQDEVEEVENITVGEVEKVEEAFQEDVVGNMIAAEDELVHDFSNVTEVHESVLESAKKVAEQLPGMDKWLRDLPRHIEVDQHGYCVRQDPYTPVYGCGLKLCKCREYLEDCAWTGPVSFLQEYETGSTKAAMLAGQQLLAGRCQSSENLSLLSTCCCFAVLVLPALLGSGLSAFQHHKRPKRPDPTA